MKMIGAIAFVLLTVQATIVFCEEPIGRRPLHTAERSYWRNMLAKDTLLLDEASVIEQFLEMLDGSPPDWRKVYGSKGSGHDERLFVLNRERDGVRDGRAVSARLLTFIWTGDLSDYDADEAGFRIAIGPKLIPTQWGLVRFKPDGLPSNLVAIPSAVDRESLRLRLGKGERVEIQVAMTGRLISEESIIYDFAHEAPGRGLVMPVVRIERLDYFLVR